MSNQKWPQRRNGRAILAAVAGVTLSLFLVSACGGGDGDSPALSGGEVSAAGVTLNLPDGWAFLDNGDRGLVLAELEADLTAVVLQGPRLTVEPGNTTLPDPEALVSAMAGTDGAETRVEVVEEPETVSVGAEEGVSIGLLEDEGGGAVIGRYVIVSADGISVYQFLLEAPAEMWEVEKHGLGTIVASARFD